jgi:hypothetical protein
MHQPITSLAMGTSTSTDNINAAAVFRGICLFAANYRFTAVQLGELAKNELSEAAHDMGRYWLSPFRILGADMPVFYRQLEFEQKICHMFCGNKSPFASLYV